jgi:hypothetical protein
MTLYTFLLILLNVLVEIAKKKNIQTCLSSILLKARMFGTYHLPFLKHFQVVGRIEPFFKVDNLLKFVVEGTTSSLISLIYINDYTTNTSTFTDYLP